MLLDGVSLVDRFGGGVNRVQPGLDTIEEFRIETTGSSAQYSRPATVEMVTKSGTNQLRGSAFPRIATILGLRARRRAGRQHARQAHSQRVWRLGRRACLSAKIYDGRNKTFWFAAYEVHGSASFLHPRQGGDAGDVGRGLQPDHQHGRAADEHLRSADHFGE